MRTEHPRFQLGRTVITPGALDALHPEDAVRCLHRHGQGDWGDCTQEDWAENDLALGKYLRIFSVYHDRNGVKFWVITEADRSATTILLPSEY